MAAPRRYFGTLSVVRGGESGGQVYDLYRTAVEAPKGTPTEELLDVLLDSAKEFYGTDNLIVMSWTMHPEVM